MPFTTFALTPATLALLMSLATVVKLVPDEVIVVSLNTMLLPAVIVGLVAVPITVAQEFFHASLPTSTQLFAVTTGSLTVLPGDL